MSKRYRAWTPRQLHLLPVSPLEWLAGDHLVYFVLEVVEQLDLAVIESVIHAKDARGTRPYSPRMMTALLLYAYCVGFFSSRKIARATYEDVAMRVLAGGEHPHFSTVSQFRLLHREALAGLFQQVLGLCRKAGLVKLGHVSLDGTKVQANASQHKAMSYKRMNEEDKRLAAEIEQLLAKADAVDAYEDKLFGEGEDEDDHALPEELRRRETRRERIRQAMAELKREAALARADELDKMAEGQQRRSTDELLGEIERKRAATRARHSRDKAHTLRKRHQDDDDEPPRLFPDLPDDWPRHRVPHDKDGNPKGNAQRNFTDPDSRVMYRNGVPMQAYNVQLAVDAEQQLIVAAALTNQAPDPQHLPPMVDRVIDNCGAAPDVLTADTGYMAAHNIRHCEERGIDPYIAVGRKLSETLAKAPAHSTEATAARNAMRAKLKTEHGRDIYRRRKAIVEPAIGQMKGAQGFGRFSVRGIAKCTCELLLVCTTHNLLKLFRHRTRALPARA